MPSAATLCLPSHPWPCPWLTPAADLSVSLSASPDSSIDHQQVTFSTSPAFTSSSLYYIPSITKTKAAFISSTTRTPCVCALAIRFGSKYTYSPTASLQPIVDRGLWKVFSWIAFRRAYQTDGTRWKRLLLIYGVLISYHAKKEDE